MVTYGDPNSLLRDKIIAVIESNPGLAGEDIYKVANTSQSQTKHILSQLASSGDLIPDDIDKSWKDRTYTTITGDIGCSFISISLHIYH